jgi:hypothetical protein
MVLSLQRQWVALIHMPTQRLPPEILTAAIEGSEQQKLRIDEQIAELRTMLPGGRTVPVAMPGPAKRKRRKMSAAARKRIGDAQRKRWAASKKPAEPSAPEAPPKPKRKLSAAGKAAIVAATKRRWALKRAEAAKAEQAAAKKTATRKTAPAKAAKKSAPVKRAPLKKPAAKKTAPAAAQSVTETGGQ